MLTLGCITAEVEVQDYIPELWKEIERTCIKIKDTYELRDISQLPRIRDARKVYRTLGKDPTRYRLSSESLVRRILKGQNLYQVNNIVDINNLISLSSLFSLGSYDRARIGDKINCCIGKADEKYIGIGRGVLNIENLPVLADEVGSFGSPTSDSERGMITDQVKNILMNIISFSGDDGVEENLDYAKRLLETYAKAKRVEYRIVH